MDYALNTSNSELGNGEFVVRSLDHRDQWWESKVGMKVMINKNDKEWWWYIMMKMIRNIDDAELSW